MKLRLLMVALLAAQLAFSQTGTGKIQGTVKDASGAVVPGAKVTATHKQSARAYGTSTNEAGLYVFPAVQNGDYIVLTIGEPYGKAGGTNTMKIVKVGEQRRR